MCWIVICYNSQVWKYSYRLLVVLYSRAWYNRFNVADKKCCIKIIYYIVKQT